MQFSIVLVSAVAAIIATHPNVYLHCQPQFFNPLNYLPQLPSLKMPYVNNLPIPNIPLAHVIRPTPAITTKVINVVTKYVARNPVCIKTTGKKKPPCKKDAASATKNYANDHIVTKEYFVSNRASKQNPPARAENEEAQLKKIQAEVDAIKNLQKIGTRPESISNMADIEGSEAIRTRPTVETKYRRVARHVPGSNSNSRSQVADDEREQSESDDNDEDGVGDDDDDDEDEDDETMAATPELRARKLIKASATGATPEKMKDLLIEDRLDRLEDMLPHYTRMRVYQTSTITVTRTRMARMATATLVVKNCVPDGIDYCKKRQRNASTDTKKMRKKSHAKRTSKVAVEQNPTLPNYAPFYYG